MVPNRTLNVGVQGTNKKTLDVDYQGFAVDLLCLCAPPGARTRPCKAVIVNRLTALTLSMVA